MSILSVVHAGGGGTILTNEDLMRSLSRRHDCHILACGPSKWVLFKVEADAIPRIEEVKFDAAWRGGATMSADRAAAIEDLMSRRRFDVVHVRSFLGSGPEIIPLLKRMGAPVVVSFHDFTAICPTIQLLDADNMYCAGSCTAGAKDCAAPKKWFSDLGRLKHAYVHVWRERMARSLPDAAAYVTTWEGGARLLSDHFPFLDGRVRVIEHGRDLKRRSVAVEPSLGAPTRVLVLGVIGAAKGRALIEALARRNAADALGFEFHVQGRLDPPLEDVPGLIVHGEYERDGLAERVEAIAPSFSLIASLWPETYSHTLTESWACGMPVLASDLGAPADRIRRSGGGWLLDPKDPEAWLACLSAARASPALWRAKAARIRRLRFPSIVRMARAYEAVYGMVLAKARKDPRR